MSNNKHTIKLDYEHSLIDVKKIDPSPFQVRKYFAEDVGIASRATDPIPLNASAASLRTLGSSAFIASISAAQKVSRSVPRLLQRTSEWVYSNLYA